MADTNESGPSWITVDAIGRQAKGGDLCRRLGHVSQAKGQAIRARASTG